MQWWDVVKSHGSQAGIATKGGRVTSLLCGSRYEDRFEEEKILYHAEQGTPGLAQLLQATKDGYSFSVFRKRAKNDWESLGYFKAMEVFEQPHGKIKQYIFTLVPATG